MILSRLCNPVMLVSALSLCAGAQAQTPPNYSPDYLKQPDFSPGPLKKIEGLNSAQQQAVEDYVRQGERRTGELKVLVDRSGIVLRSSEALRTLFPNDRFVAVTWIYEADPRGVNKYSIPGPTVHTHCAGRRREGLHGASHRLFGRVRGSASRPQNQGDR